MSQLGMPLAGVNIAPLGLLPPNAVIPDRQISDVGRLAAGVQAELLNNVDADLFGIGGEAATVFARIMKAIDKRLSMVENRTNDLVKLVELDALTNNLLPPQQTRSSSAAQPGSFTSPAPAGLSLSLPVSSGPLPDSIYLPPQSVTIPDIVIPPLLPDTFIVPGLLLHNFGINPIGVLGVTTVSDVGISDIVFTKTPSGYIGVFTITLSVQVIHVLTPVQNFTVNPGQTFTQTVTLPPIPAILGGGVISGLTVNTPEATVPVPDTGPTPSPDTGPTPSSGQIIEDADKKSGGGISKLALDEDLCKLRDWNKIRLWLRTQPPAAYVCKPPAQLVI